MFRYEAGGFGFILGMDSNRTNADVVTDAYFPVHTPVAFVGIEKVAFLGTDGHGFQYEYTFPDAVQHVAVEVRKQGDPHSDLIGSF